MPQRSLAPTEIFDLLATAQLYDLEQPRDLGAPTFAAHLPGYHYSLHRRHEAGLGEARTSASGVIVTVDHSGTHIDALCHQAENLVMYGGRTVDASVQTPIGFTELGAETIAPIVARGLLLDVARYEGVDRLPSQTRVTADQLANTSREAQVIPSPGDVVLVRTGNGALWGNPVEYERGPGISAEASAWLAAHRPRAVGVDNLAWDVAGSRDPELGTLAGHVVLIVRNGIHIIENLLLEELSESGHHEFLFICLPLKLCGATGAPVRPLAVVLDGDGSDKPLTQGEPV